VTRRKNTSRDAGALPDPVTRYAEGVVERKIIAGPLVRLAAERHLRDLRDGPKRGLIWDVAAALRAIRFFPDVLRLAEGEFEGQPFTLQPWQQFCIGSLFGWKVTDLSRRFRNAYLEVAKGNGKTPMAAGVGIYMLTSDGEPGAEIYSAATMKDQAKICFLDADGMVEKSPALSRRITRTLNNLAYTAKRSFFRPVSSEKRGLDGKRVHCALIDELHEHPSPIVVEKMRAGTKGRRQAMIVEITNAGVDRNSICWQHHQYSERVLKQLVDDDAWFAFVCGIDEGDDWRDELVWPKANPNLNVSIAPRYLREQVREAVGMPAKQSMVLRLNFCVWVDAEAPWIDGDLWRKCETQLDRASLKGRRCYGGLDLAGKNDLTALVLAFDNDDGSIACLTWFWSPGDTLRERSERDQVPYVLWRDQKFLEAPPGRALDYEFVAKRLGELNSEFEIAEIAYDPYRIDDLARACEEAGVAAYIAKSPADRGEGIRLVPHHQGFITMGATVDALETCVLNGHLRVQANPVMSMCSANAVLTQDAAGNRKFDKRPGKSYGRIDGIVALAMAVRRTQMATVPMDLNAIILRRGGLI
jgi:phage terminase large subunit-like protein